MRVALITLLVGCGFGAKVSSQEPPDPDATMLVADAPPGDTTPVMTPTVRRVEIMPGRVTGTHTDFPVLFTASITSAHAMGYDIYFSTDQAGTMKLAHEIERYQPNELVAWVKIPSLSSATQIYLHYGDTTITTSQENRTAVWSASYAAVWHLSSLDDARGLNNATATGATAVAGKIADARGFDGTDDHLDAGSNTAIDSLFAGGGGTMEAWFLATTAGENGFGRIFDKGIVGLGMCAGNTGGTNAVLFQHEFSGFDGIWCTAMNTITLGQWTYVAVTYDRGATTNDPAFYLNGTASAVGAVKDTPSGNAVSDDAAPLFLGDQPTGSRAFDGRVDEARLSSVRRSADWIKTSYENQREPGTFFVLSGPL